MGEEKKKEKKRAKGSNTSLKNTPLKKKKKLHSIKSLWWLLSFGWSYWVSNAPTG